MQRFRRSSNDLNMALKYAIGQGSQEPKWCFEHHEIFHASLALIAFEKMMIMAEPT